MTVDRDPEQEKDFADAMSALREALSSKELEGVAAVLVTNDGAVRHAIVGWVSGPVFVGGLECAKTEVLMRSLKGIMCFDEEEEAEGEAEGEEDADDEGRS